MSDMEEWSKRIEENEINGNAKADEKKAMNMKKTGTSVPSAAGIPSSGS